MIEIVNASKKDLNNVAKMYVEVYSKFLPNEGWTVETALNFIEYSYNSQPDLFFVAKDKGGGGFPSRIHFWIR